MLDDLLALHTETLRLCEARAALDWDLVPAGRRSWFRALFRRDAQPLNGEVTVLPARADAADEPTLPRAA